jgi:hypothetical protein
MTSGNVRLVFGYYSSLKIASLLYYSENFRATKDTELTKGSSIIGAKPI